MPEGSHTTWGTYDSRTCIICGQPIRITTQAAWMHYDHLAGMAASAHIHCGTPLGGTMTETTETEPTTEPDPEPENGDDDGDGDATDDQ